MVTRSILKQELALNDRMQREDRRNQRFRAMTPAKQRVVIAKDVLKWLDSKKLRPWHGYVKLTEGASEDSPEVRHDTVNGYTCHACGIGSLFACAVERGVVKTLLSVPWEGARARPPGDAEVIWDKLSDLFAQEQLILVEGAYEGSADRWTQGGVCGSVHGPFMQLPQETRGYCYAWREQINDDELRMRAIMQCIIDNKGDFKPEQLGKYIPVPVVANG